MTDSSTNSEPADISVPSATRGDSGPDPEGVDPGPDHAAPSECPVCGAQLFVTRLGCTSCGSELAGVFTRCEFCALSSADRQLLRVFLASRGNLREVERHLKVSYPTARVRFTELLERMGLAGGSETSGHSTVPAQADSDGLDHQQAMTGPRRAEILTEVACGTLSPDQAALLLQPSAEED